MPYVWRCQISYNGSGTFNINTSGQPVVTGTVISSTAFNALTADLGTGLSTAITKNGQTTVTANIPFNGFKLTGIGVATASGDALTYGQAATVTTLVASTSITDSGLTSGRVTYAGTAGLLQDSAALTYDGTAVTINKNSSALPASPVAAGGMLLQLGNADAAQTSIVLDSFGSSPNFNFRRASGTNASKTAVTTGAIGQIRAYGYGSTAYSGIRGQISFTATETWTDTAQGCNINISPTATGSTTLSTNVGSFTGTGLDVTGTLSATGTGQVGTTLGVGAATPSASGAGITFPATQSASTDANTLDDYEEGTWTPTLTSSSGTITTPGTCTGTYTKIGRFVIIRCTTSITTLGTAAGDLRISGSPFVPAVSVAGSGQCIFNGIGLSVGMGSSYITAAKYDGTTILTSASAGNNMVTVTFEV